MPVTFLEYDAISPSAGTLVDGYFLEYCTSHGELFRPIEDYRHTFASESHFLNTIVDRDADHFSALRMLGLLLFTPTIIYDLHSLTSRNLIDDGLENIGALTPALRITSFPASEIAGIGDSYSRMLTTFGLTHRSAAAIGDLIASDVAANYDVYPGSELIKVTQDVWDREGGRALPTWLVDSNDTPARAFLYLSISARKKVPLYLSDAKQQSIRFAASFVNGIVANASTATDPTNLLQDIVRCVNEQLEKRSQVGSHYSVRLPDLYSAIARRAWRSGKSLVDTILDMREEQDGKKFRQQYSEMMWDLASTDWATVSKGQAKLSGLKAELQELVVKEFGLPGDSTNTLDIVVSFNPIDWLGVSVSAPMALLRNQLNAWMGQRWAVGHMIDWHRMT